MQRWRASQLRGRLAKLEREFSDYGEEAAARLKDLENDQDASNGAAFDAHSWAVEGDVAIRSFLRDQLRSGIRPRVVGVVLLFPGLLLTTVSASGARSRSLGTCHGAARSTAPGRRSEAALAQLPDR